VLCSSSAPAVWRATAFHWRDNKLLCILTLLALLSLIAGCGQEQNTAQTPPDSKLPARGSQTEEEERKGWEEASRTNTLAGWSSFLAKFGGGKHAEEAKTSRTTLETLAARAADESAWEAAVKSDSEAGFHGYLRAFGAGIHVKEADIRIAALVESAARDAEDNAWSEVLRAESVENLQGYLDRYSSGRHATEARARLASLGIKARKQADENAWSAALREGTAAGFNNYIKDFIAGTHTAEAQERLRYLERRTQDTAEKQAWEEVLRAETIVALNRYLDQFPTGAHRTDGRRRLAKLKLSAGQIPTIDAKRSCKASADAVSRLIEEGRAQDRYESCLSSEGKARDEIVRQWTSYTSADKTSCIQKNIYQPSYVEWLTCLELRVDVRKLPKDTLQ